MGIDGGVNQCSASYNGGKYAGYALGAATYGVGSLSAGYRSVFYSGSGSLEAAQLGKGSGKILADTLGGKALNWIDSTLHRLPDTVWREASRIFAANAKGEAQVFLRDPVNPAGIWTTVEQPTLKFFNNTKVINR